MSTHPNKEASLHGFLGNQLVHYCAIRTMWIDRLPTSRCGLIPEANPETSAQFDVIRCRISFHIPQALEPVEP